MQTRFPSTEGRIPFRGHETWYRIVGEGEEPGKLPLLTLHGGPGACHDYLESMEALAATGRRVCMLGCEGRGLTQNRGAP
jgi:pimeloyl-ACP methyl ester carboxylesterase